MIERIFKNWKTTAIGLIIMAVCIVAFFIDKVSLMEMFAGMGAGLALFFLKDKPNVKV